MGGRRPQLHIRELLCVSHRPLAASKLFLIPSVLPCMCCALHAGVVKMRRGLTARVFGECEGMSELYSWFLRFLYDLQEKALLQVDRDDPTREVRRWCWRVEWCGVQPEALCVGPVCLT